jgi:hypothetical protein
MIKFKPVKTKIGTLFGRDAIYLDEYSSRNGGYELFLKGEINGALASESPSKGMCSYEILFTGVIALKITELDTYEAYQAKLGWPETSFDEVLESDWITSLDGKVNSKCKEFVFQTYDYVFEVICSEYHLEIIKGKNP